MALGFKDGYITSIFGRRLGLQQLTSSISGSTINPQGEFLIGPDAFRAQVSSGETMAVKLRPWGVSFISTTTTAATTSTIYELEPPIPGVTKTLVFGSTNTATNMVSVRASTGATICFLSTVGSTHCVASSSGGSQAAIHLMGVNSTSWAILGAVSTGTILFSTTST
jgi:hypothetical protein